MQRSAKRIVATAAATLALLLSGIGLASADETGESNGSILSGNNVDLDVLNNVTVCDIAVAALIGFAGTSGDCDVENEYREWDDADKTGDSNGSILSGNNLDANVLNNVTVCDIAVGALIGFAHAGGDCEVENEFSDGGSGDGDVTGESNGSILSGNNLDINAGNNVTVCGISVAVAGIASTDGCEVDNEHGKKKHKKKPPHNGNGDNGNGNGHNGNGNGHNGNGNGNGHNGNGAPPPNGKDALPVTGARALTVLAPLGLALVLGGVALYRRSRRQESPVTWH